jgi:DNA-binding MarR family transcriptional regulator
MLAIRGHDDPRGPTIGDVSEYLVCRHHSVVELVDRAEKAGLVRRTSDPSDHRAVRLALTRDGARTMERLGAITLEELARIAPRMRALWAGLGAVPAGR